MRLTIPFLIVVVVLNALPWYGDVTANSRLSPAMEADLGHDASSYSVQVEFSYPPEYFHVQALQAIGTVAGVQGDTIRVIRITAAQVRQIAGFYWVKEVAPLSGSGS